MSTDIPPLPTPPTATDDRERIVDVQDLSRTFGAVQAVAGISFDIRRGQVVGFIGANGAGKTTTMRILATLDHPTGGSAKVCGHDVIHHPADVRRQVGWMPDNYGTYDNMTVWEYLDFYGRAYGFRRAERARRIQEVMVFADLTPLADRFINRLSKGMGQRLCFGRTLLHDPELLILDEPAAGLDPKARIEFKNLIRLLSQRGKTIFISSHILSELGEMCDHLLFIDAGRLVHLGSAESLRSTGTLESVVEVVVTGDPARLIDWVTLNAGWSVVEQRRHGARLRLDSDHPDLLADGLRRMIAEGVPVVDFHREERRLEDAFVDMIKQRNP